MSREAMKLALDALVFAAYEDIEYDDACDQKVREARNALRQALAQPEQEPVAWMHTTGTGHVYFRKKPQDKVFNPQPVYTAAPKSAEWVGLTDEEIDALSQARSLTDELMDCVDRLGSEADTVDPRVWQHLLVYAPKPEEEPVAWISDSPTKGNGKQLHWTKAEAWRWSSNITPLYTAPPKREWVGLTDAEVYQAIRYQRHKYSVRGQIITPADGLEWHFAKAIEQALKEKNT